MLDETIRKRDMKQFLDEMKLKAHWLYALMCNATADTVWITRDDDWDETLEQESITAVIRPIIDYRLCRCIAYLPDELSGAIIP